MLKISEFFDFVNFCTQFVAKIPKFCKNSDRTLIGIFRSVRSLADRTFQPRPASASILGSLLCVEVPFLTIRLWGGFVHHPRWASQLFILKNVISLIEEWNIKVYTPITAFIVTATIIKKALNENQIPQDRFLICLPMIMVRST